MTQFESISDVTKFYAEYAKTYDNDISLDSYPAPFIVGQFTLEYLNKTFPLMKTINVLDLGCGTVLK